MALAKNDKIIKYPPKHPVNMGVIIFAIIIIYVLFSLFKYLTTKQIAEYEVHQGSIASNNVYKGLILREEQVIYTDDTGNVNYYLKNGTKAAANDIVYSLDTNGNLSNEITQESSNGKNLTTEDLRKISEKIDAFTSTYSSKNFYDVYSFKNDINSELSQTLNTTALNNLSEQVGWAESNGTFSRKTAPQSGIVLYYIDNFEGKTVDDFSPQDLDATTYTKQSLFSDEKIQAGSPVYKLVTSENWHIIIPISNNMAESIKDESYLKVRFCKDNRTANAACTIIHREDSYFLDLYFTNSMIRYANERYMNVELIMDEENGLKIPNTSIASKDFFAIPIEYFSQADDNSNLSLYLKTYENGKESINVISPDIYSKTETSYYVDDEYLSSGDILVKPDSEQTYTVGTNIEPLEGVYNINKGFAVFKKIDILYQNEEYTIIRSKTPYGVTLYDHIALDGSAIKEDQLIVK